jgi:hypothetical protein
MTSTQLSRIQSIFSQISSIDNPGELADACFKNLNFVPDPNSKFFGGPSTKDGLACSLANSILGRDASPSDILQVLNPLTYSVAYYPPSGIEKGALLLTMVSTTSAGTSKRLAVNAIPSGSLVLTPETVILSATTKTAIVLVSGFGSLDFSNSGGFIDPDTIVITYKKNETP